MARTTAIQWTSSVQPDGTVTPGASWNPWSGCHKVTSGCDHCYAERITQRFGRDFGAVTRAPEGRFKEPLGWERGLVRRSSGAAITPLRVFTCSMSDWFHPDADAWRDEAWAIIRQTPHLTYQILTKRANRIAGHLPADWGTGYPNVWLGVTVEEQATAFRLAQLAAVPAAIHFVSYEPGIGPLRFSAGLQPDWLIIGGESGGQEARPLHLEWAREAVRLCRLLGVAPFVKQLGSVWARGHRAKDSHGGDWDEWPADLRIREFPAVAPAPAVFQQAALL